MEFQKICHVQLVFMPTSLKSAQCNECLAVCINYAFCANTSLFETLRIFVPEHAIDGVPKRLSFSGGFHLSFMPTKLKSSHAMSVWQCTNYAFCAITSLL